MEHDGARAGELYGALATGGELNGYRVLTRASIKRAHTEQANGPDLVLGVVTRWGMGFWLNQPVRDGDARTFGHTGAGGGIGFADPDARVGFGYTMNGMDSDPLIDGRASTLLDAMLRRCRTFSGASRRRINPLY